MSPLPKLGEAGYWCFCVGGFVSGREHYTQYPASKHTPNLDKAGLAFTMFFSILIYTFTTTLPRFDSIVSIENKIGSYKYQIYVFVFIAERDYWVQSGVSGFHPTLEGML